MFHSPSAFYLGVLNHKTPLVTVCVCLVLGRVRLSVAPWTVAHQAPLSMGLPRQEHWGGLPCPPLGDLPSPGIEPMSLTSSALAGRFFTTSATWEAISFYNRLGKSSR